MQSAGTEPGSQGGFPALAPFPLGTLLHLLALLGHAQTPSGRLWGTQKVAGSVKWGARQSVSAEQLSSLLGNTQQAKRTSHYEWLLCKTKQRATELRTGDLQNIGLSERSQFKKVTSIQFHVRHSEKGKRDRNQISGCQGLGWGT